MYAPPKRNVGDQVFSTGFHTSKEGHWIPPGSQGEIVKISPCHAVFYFDSAQTQPYAVLTSDIANTEREAFGIAASNRREERWTK